MRFLLYLLIPLGLALTHNAYADEVFPAACKPLVIKGESVKLHSETPRIVMLHNLSVLDLWVTHPVSEGDNAGLSSRLQTGLWSALALDNTSFELSCIESRPGHEQQVSCEQNLALCEWPITSQPENTQGVFWAGENMPLTALTAYISRRGFGLPSQAQ